MGDYPKQTILDQINEYLFTMSEDELKEVLQLIEDYISGHGEE